MSVKIKKAILTGGGRATRLRPITSTINKHLIPLANKPMIYHAIEKVVEAGVEEIFINTNPGERVLKDHIGDGGHWGVKIHFFEQVGGPQGVAHVVKQAEQFIANDPFIFYLSDNIILGSLNELVDEYFKGGHDCVLALSEVAESRHFGVPVFDHQGNLSDVWEKPINPPNNFAVTGIYIYGPKVFFEAFQNIKKSDRGEYEISSIHSHLLKNNYKVGYKEITGWWRDTGQAHDLICANTLLINQIPKENYLKLGQVESGAKLEGLVHIGAGTNIKNNVKIVGPVIIGENCILDNCVILPATTINPGCVIKHATIEKSIILSNANIDADIHITESIIGESTVIKKKNEGLKYRVILGDQTLMEL